MPPDDQSQAAPEAEDDLKSLLNAAFDEQEATPEAPEKPEVSGKTRERGADGKFAKSEGAEPETPESPAAPDAEKPEVDAKPAEKTTEAPKHWSAPDQEAFKELTPKAQAAWLRRDQEMTADYTRKTQEIASLRRDYEPVQQILKPYEDQIRGKGFTPASLIQAWSNVEIGLANPQTAPKLIADIIGNYKVDRAQIAQLLGLTGAGGTGGAGTETPPAPNGAQPIIIPPELQREFDALRNGHQQVTQFLTGQQEQQDRENLNRMNSTIAAFQDAKDDKGIALHPHFAELEDQMVSLIVAARTRGRVMSLPEAYETAVWANPSTRQKTLDGQHAADEAQRVAGEKKKTDEARAKAERARKASSSVTGAPGSGQARMTQAQAEGGSLRDQLYSAFEDASDAA